MLIEEGDTLVVEVVMKEKSFKVDGKISLNPQEIGEIFWSAAGMIGDLAEKVKHSVEGAKPKTIKGTSFTGPIPHFMSFLPDKDDTTS